MSDELKISLKRPLKTHRCDWDDPEEAATRGSLTIETPSHILTSGFDKRTKKRRDGPLVSAYPVAEWFAWNWWRLISEISERPANGSAARRWDFSHGLSNIGSGYDWPNISIYSDGCKSYLHSTRSMPGTVKSFEYYVSYRVDVSTKTLESALSKFIEATIKRLEDSGIRDSNLQRLWDDLRSEQADPDDMRYRTMEARLGFDPDELKEEIVLGILADAERIGRDALDEVAADAAQAGNSTDDFPTAKMFQDVSNACGTDASQDPMVTLSGKSSDCRNDVWKYGETEAWQIGKWLAGKLRLENELNGHSISNRALAQFAGVDESFVANGTLHWEKMSFFLQRDDTTPRLTLRPKGEAGRRFELARLIGDHVAREYWEFTEDRLLPATGTKSYRQKLQRAFAAELLCPISYIDEIVGSDYSIEKQENAAEKFNVSNQVISWQLWNHDRIGEPNIL